MRCKSLSLILGLMFILLTAGVVIANLSPPGGPPKVFSGEVYVNGTILDERSYTLTAWIGDSAVSQTSVSSGEYSDLQISTSDNFGTITFFINGVEANEVDSWNNDRDDDWGKNVKLNLTLNNMPEEESLCVGGDTPNAIDPGEECDGTNLAGRTSCGEGYKGTISCSDSCLIDYSNCTKIQDPNNNNNNNGGGSGGGSGGGGGGAPSSSDSTTTTDNNDVSDSNNEEENNSNSTESSSQTSQEDPPGIFGITGLAIGDFARTDAGKGVLTVIILAIILGLIYFAKKKYSKDDKKKGNKKSSKKKSNGSGKKKASGKKTKNVKTVKLSDLKNRKK